MAIERKSIVDQIEITRGNVLQVRIALLLVDTETGVEVSSKWHRTSVELDGSPVAQMAAVNVHLNQMGEALIAQGDIDKVKLYHATMVTMA